VKNTGTAGQKNYLITSVSLKLRRHIYPRDVVSGVLATATCLGTWLSQPVLYQND